jgi:hypothetical protein
MALSTAMDTRPKLRTPEIDERRVAIGLLDQGQLAESI